MRTIQLSKKEEAAVEGLVRSGTHGERRRAQGILFWQRGQTQAEAAKLLGVEERSMRKWARRFRERGVEGLRRKRRCYERPKMSDEREKRLIEVVRQSPESVGMEGNGWNCRMLSRWFADTFSVRLSDEWIRQTLLRHGLRFRRAKLKLTSPDPEYAKKKLQSMG
jgi:transposase